MVGPHAPAHETNSDTATNHERVAEDWFTAEGWDDLGDDAEGRQDQDVDLRVAKDPEQMLPQQWATALFDIKEVGVEAAIKGEQEQCDRDHRNGEQQQELHHEHHPGEDRHLQ